ncbi:accessory gene regulator B family protein [Lysinibacillus xylanilyticus]|uniref:accessory gene regulator B family protein n=1 Tax=Lysinibacillus xylanilyticus TaxID=582475 RepID=UPI002B24F753|nr:accessory gene regulator B family protein [Lysinibacillus xylanilyticus]MEB2300805.1 accessory gene regulator B family protein [Lysinibacillus xylanilyticus]
MVYTLKEQTILGHYKKFVDMSELDEIKLIHGLRIFLMDFKKFIIIYSLAFILGIAWQLALVHIGFFYFRQVAFGLHCTSFKTCLVTSTILFLSFTYLFLNIINFTPIFIWVIFLACVGVLSLLAPISSQKNKIRSAKHISYLRKKMYKRFLITMIVIIVLPLTISKFIVAGMLLETFTIIYSWLKSKEEIRC